MEPGREELEDIMRRNGLVEKEALAAYHLHRTREVFEELYGPEGDHELRFVRDFLNEIHFGIHFTALTKMLGLRVLRRDYPEGWSRRRQTGTEK